MFYNARSTRSNAPSRASTKSFKSAATSAARSFRSARSQLSRGSSRSGRSSLGRATSRPRRATSRVAPSPYYGPPLTLNAVAKARIPNMTAPIPNSNSNSSWNGIIVPSRAPRVFTQYGTAQTGRQLMRTMANVPQSQNDRLLTNAVLRRTARLRELLVESGMDPKLATSKALAKLNTFLEPNIRNASRSVAVKRMRAKAAASMQAQRERAASAARTAKMFAVARVQAMKQRAVEMQRRQANRSAALWSRTVGGGQAMWKGTTKAATSAAAAMAAEARRSRNGIVGGARSTARVFDSRIVAPINMGVVRPVRGASYERRIQKILAEMSNLTRQRNMLTPGKGRNVDRIRKINASLKALKKQKNLLNATWTNKNEKAAGWAWLKKFGQRA